MSLSTDIRVVATTLYFLPVQTRVPLKFGTETLTSATIARARVAVADAGGRVAHGWGETPLSVQWVWPSPTPLEPRHAALKQFTCELAEAWVRFDGRGHAFEVGHDFVSSELPRLLSGFNRSREGEAMPWLAALVAARSLTRPSMTPLGNSAAGRCIPPTTPSS
jgi:hypothetical protein